MDVSHENEKKLYEIRPGTKKGTFQVVTHTKDGADQFEVDSVLAAEDLNEPAQVTLGRMLRRQSRRPRTGRTTRGQ